MSAFELIKTRFFAGHWEGILRRLSGDRDPEIEISHLETPIPFELLPHPENPGQWGLRFTVPTDLLSDGAQVFLIYEKQEDTTLGSFTIISGEPLQEDFRAELELLRAELDMLKRAFRRHCLETA
jgi:hypothetical protein